MRSREKSLFVVESPRIEDPSTRVSTFFYLQAAEDFYKAPLIVDSFQRHNDPACQKYELESRTFVTKAMLDPAERGRDKITVPTNFCLCRCFLL